MLLKINRGLAGLFFALLFVFPVVSAEGDEQTCKKMTLGQVLLEKEYSPFAMQEKREELQKLEDLNEDKAQLKVQQLLVRRAVEIHGIPTDSYTGKKLLSIINLFENQGCSVQEKQENSIGQGIIDIFVVVGEDGWIDHQYKPIFHESHSDEKIQFQDEKNSFYWLKPNLPLELRKIGSAYLEMAGTTFFITGLKVGDKYKKEFRGNVEWLREQLETGNFNRTASVLDEDGQLRVYEVKVLQKNN